MNITKALQSLATTGFQGPASEWTKAIIAQHGKVAYRSVWTSLQLLAAKQQEIVRSGSGRDAIYAGQKQPG